MSAIENTTGTEAVTSRATDVDLWTSAMNSLLFLSPDLGPSING